MTLHLIRLELAREKSHPAGSSLHGYEFVAPLDDEGHLDRQGWIDQRKNCTTRRFWQGEQDQTGELVHTRGGSWAFSYDPSTTDDDEAIFRLDRHVLRPGEYVSVIEPNREQHTFRVASVSRL